MALPDQPDQLLTDPEERAEFQRDFRAHIAVPDPLVEIRCDRITAWALMQACQLMSKHPLVPDKVRATVVGAGRTIQTEITPTPILQKVAEMGWEEDVMTRAARSLTVPHGKPQA